MTSKICIVCYDVSNNKVRRKLANLISEFGKRVQGSVFLCDISSKRVAELNARLRSFYMNSRQAQARDKTIPMKAKKAKAKSKTNANAKANEKAKAKAGRSNNTLDILVIPVNAEQLDNALVLGKPLDCNKKFAVI